MLKIAVNPKCNWVFPAIKSKNFGSEGCRKGGSMGAIAPIDFDQKPSIINNLENFYVKMGIA